MPDCRRRARWPAVLAFVLSTGSAGAALAAGTAWSALTPEQRSALAPLERDWAGIDASRQQKWLEIAARFPRISDEERQRVQQRMSEWARMSPRERGEARINYQEIRQISPQERQARWESYRALSDEQRRELAARARPAAAASAVPRTDRDKSNIVAAPSAPLRVRPVAPTVMQVSPGATTTLVTRPPQPPLHQQAGLPKIAATPAFVDTATLLPKRGAQGAAVAPATPPARPAPRAVPASAPASAAAPVAATSDAAASAEAAPAASAP